MIMADMVTNLLLKMNLYMTKKGQDAGVRRELISAINAITGEDSLDMIFVNNVNNCNCPDVAVIPLYNEGFGPFLLDGDLSNTCPFGYTIEINAQCFDKYTPEELTAVIIHDILQNIQSCTAKTRFMKAYNAAISSHNNAVILKLFDGLNASEVMFLIYMDICCRPFRVPATDYDYLGTDEVLKSMKLDDAYDSYLNKITGTTLATPDDVITAEVKADYRTAETVVNSCIDKDIRHYFEMIKNGVPLVSLGYIFGAKATTTSLGFVSNQKKFKPRTGDNEKSPKTMNESFVNPKSETELRFQIDKIISEKRYAESEAEREVVLIKIKNLTLKLLRTKEQIDKRLERTPLDKVVQHEYEVVANMLEELEALRKSTVNMEIKEKRYGVFVKYPVGYEG